MRLEKLIERLFAALGLEASLHRSLTTEGCHRELSRASRSPRLLNDVQTSTDPDSEWMRASGFTAYASWPLLEGDELLGTLDFGARGEHGFSEASLELQNILCDLLSSELRGERIELELRASADRFRHLIGLTGALAVWSTDPAGRLAGDVRSLQTRTGESVEKLREEGWLGAVHPEDREDVEDRWRKALSEKRPLTAELRLHQPGDRWVWTRLTAAPFLEPDGTTREWLGLHVDITDRKEIEADLADLRRLQELSSAMIRETEADGLLREILSTAITLMRADMGEVQTFDPETKTLKLAAQHGLERRFLKRFGHVSVNTRSCCGAALASGRRVVVPDIEASDVFSGATCDVVLRTGARAVQSTPLVSSSGEVLGMLSTHWRRPHQPEPRELRALDALAREAGDVISHHRLCEAVERRERHLRELSRSLDARVAERTAELEEIRGRLGQMAAELTASEQRERKRLATLLHDDLQQLLVAVRMRVNRLRGLVAEAEGLAELQTVEQLLDEALDSARDLTRQLRPPILYQAGLVPAVTWLAAEMRRRHRLDVHVEADDDAGRSLSDDVAGLVFESVRELLMNVVKHSGVSTATVSLKETSKDLRVLVRDGGCGFEVEAVKPREPGMGFGLFSIRDRLSAVGGEVEIHSAPEKGARIELRIPLASRGNPGPTRS